MTDLPAHDWLLSLLIPVTGAEVAKMASGARKVFKKIEVPGVHVRASAVFCGRCQLPWEKMTEYERAGCRGGLEET